MKCDCWGNTSYMIMADQIKTNTLRLWKKELDHGQKCKSLASWPMVSNTGLRRSEDRCLETHEKRGSSKAWLKKTTLSFFLSTFQKVKEPDTEER